MTVRHMNDEYRQLLEKWMAAHRAAIALNPLLAGGSMTTGDALDRFSKAYKRASKLSEELRELAKRS
jgi:hypothetical protein